MRKLVIGTFPRAAAIGLSVIAFSFACPCTGSAQAPLLFAKLPSNLVRTPQPRQLSLADRVAYQYAIEEVYWRHRIWPRENASAKPSLDAVISPAQVRQKVENYLRNSQVLTEQWQQPITPEQLQREMERMARDTKQPDVLHELFSALGNDPAIIAECLARQVLTERLVRELSLRDKRYGEQPIEGDERTYAIAAELKKIAVHEFEKGEMPEVIDVGSGYTLPGIGGNCTDNTWTATTSVNAPSQRSRHTAVWTGTEMIVWGGDDGISSFNTGSGYNPATDSWAAITVTNAPGATNSHTAVWTGVDMIVWGPSQNGGRYNPSTNSWIATTTTNAPSRRQDYTAVWTGSEMIIWGGFFFDGGGTTTLNTGGRYNPSTDSWVATTTTNAPAGSQNHTAVWTGNEMITWGGHNASGHLNSGGKYCAPPSTLGNISTRMRVETGNNVLIGGFIINGSAPKNVVVRGIGPSLVPFGIPDALADPTLELRDSGGTLARQNDNWQDDPSQASQLTALGFALQNSNESGMVASLSPAAYTAVLAGKNGGTGVGLVEIYDTNSGANSQLANISTRGFVLTGTNVMIGGFILAGANNTHVVVRGMGPSLAQFGLSPVLDDPTLELRDNNGALLVSNDNWQDDPVSAPQLTARGLAPANAAEAGIHVSLSPGAFTAIMSGKNGGTGIGLVEIYNVH